MVRSIVWTLFVGLALAFPVQAQVVHLYDGETMDAKMEFLRNLRRKGYVSLAKEFTDQLIKTASPKDLPLLQLEQARTAVAVAKETSPNQRAKMLDEARAAFEPFLKANPNSPAGAQARLEMARLFAMQGLMRLQKAYTEEGEEAREAGAKAARALYDQADAEYSAAIKVMQSINQGKDVVQAEFDRALTLIEKAGAFMNTENSTQNRQRAETVDAARKIFAEVAKNKESASGLLANAYLVKCYQELQDPPKIAEHLTIVNDAKGPNAIPAQRQAYYYDILYVKTAPNVKGDRLKMLIDRVSDWVKTYPAAKKTYEGEHLRFEQAIAHLQVAGGLTDGFKKDKYEKVKASAKDKATFENNLNASDKIAKELQAENGDFSERGTGLHNEIELVRIKLESGKAPAGFDAALLVAKIKFQDAAKAKESESAKLFNEGQVLLRNAIAIGEKDAVPITKLHEAQFLLGSAFYGVNDRRRSAISFEALARANPPSKKGAEAAAFAVELYKKFADEERDESARYFLRDLGEFVLSPAMQRLWQGDPVIAVTHYNLAMDYLAEGNHKASLAHLEKLPKEFPAFVYAQGQSVFIALTAREKEETPEAKKPWTNVARQSIARMGPLPAAADPTTTLMWFTASMEQPKFLYAEASELLRDNKEKEASGKYQEMAKSIASLKAAFDKDGGKLSDEKRKAVGFTIEVLNKYTHLGAADIEYRKGNYARVLEDDMLGGLVKEIFAQGQKNPKEPIQVVDVRVVGESLSLVLRSFIQMEKLDEAKGAYALLMRLKAASGEATDNANFTRALIQDLASQVEEMKDKGETAKIKSMVGKFTPFGDALAKTLVYDNKKPEMRDVKNLIRFYSSLDQFKKASDLIKVIPEPKYLSQKGLKATEDQERELYLYWDFQLENARLLRLSKDYEGSNKAFNRIINHENARQQTLAKMEQIHIYEDVGSFGQATKQWKTFMGDLQQAGIGQNKRMQELYFDAYYYNTLCFYKLSQKSPPDKAGIYLNLAGSMIARLENSKDKLGWNLVGPKFTDYMAREKTLKASYETALKAAK